MNIENLQTLARECCHAFNQAPISPSAGCWVIWAEICADVPATAMKYIRDKIVELDTLPRNFGKHVRHYGREWMLSRGIRNHVHKACPDCDRETVGFFTAWKKLDNGEWSRFLVRCLCNQEQLIEGMQHMAKSQAACAGYEVVPHGFEGGVLAYEMQLMGTRVDAGFTVYMKAARNRNFKKRQGHLEAMAEAEGW